jgi:CheY-like chemotaxis protein
MDEPRGLKVLVADDRSDITDTTAVLVRSWGHAVAVAYDGEAALRQAADFHPDVMLLDIGMPAMDGYEVAKAVRHREELCDTTLIAITGYGDETNRRRVREAGFDLHLIKPVDPSLLAKALAVIRQTKALLHRVEHAARRNCELRCRTALLRRELRAVFAERIGYTTRG